MKIWLDDERPVPNDTWTLCMSSGEAMHWLRTGCVKEISLDHDLGDETKVGNGYMVISYIEEQMVLNPYFKVPKVIKIHTANPVARKRMQQCLDSINKRRADQS